MPDVQLGGGSAAVAAPLCLWGQEDECDDQLITLVLTVLRERDQHR